MRPAVGRPLRRLGSIGPSSSSEADSVALSWGEEEGGLGPGYGRTGENPEPGTEASRWSYVSEERRGAGNT